MAEDAPNNPPNPDQNLYFESPFLIGESHGDDDLLGLIVEREELMDEGVRLHRETSGISEEHVEKVKTVLQQIRDKKAQLGIDPYD